MDLCWQSNVDQNKLWEIFLEMGIPDHLTCLLRNLYAGQEAIVKTGHGTADWFQIGKGVCQSCILSPCLFNFYAEYIMRNAGLEEAQAGIKIAGRNINNLRYADDTTLNGRKWRGTEEPLHESEKVGFKLNIHKTKIMISGPITSWQIDGATMETVTDFIFLGSKITAGGDCSHEIKMLAPWKKSYDQPRQHIKKQRLYFTNKGPLVKAMVFPVVIYEYESWIINKTKWWCFWNVVLEKTLESPLDCKEIKPVNPKENQPWIFIRRTDAETEAPILRPPDVKSSLIRKDLDSGKDWRQEKGVTEGEMVGWHHCLNGHEFE